MSSSFRVLGLDPGSFISGWGVVRREAGKLFLEDSGLIRPRRSDSFPKRLATLHSELTAVLERVKPDAFAIESVFHARHARSALQLGHARGVLVLAAAQQGLEVAEYPPSTVKKAVTGSGRASKEQVRKMVDLLLDTRIDGAMDRSDALAIAICHAHAAGFATRLKGSDASKSPGATPKRRMRRTKG